MIKHTTHKFNVVGMHCASCVIVTESALNDLPHVSKAVSNLGTCSVEVTGDFAGRDAEEVAVELSEVLSKHGYSLSTLKVLSQKTKWSDFKFAVPIAVAFILLFIILQKIGLVNLISVKGVSYGTAFVIGIVASLSTCMAVVGGLLLSMSATFAKEGNKVRPQLLFHVGRLVAFFVLGGLIGLLGSSFQLNSTGTFVVGVLVGLVMLILGLNLLEVFGFTRKIQPRMPKFIASRALSVSRMNSTLTPLLVGIATFFLPCGFTQAMQIYTLSTANFLSGSLTMFVFALGTLPVLALISFSSVSIHGKAHEGVFFKTVGLVVIAFALLNIINSFVGIGLVPPLFNL